MSCSTASYTTKDRALSVRRQIRRTTNIATKIRYCDRCDRYHISTDGRPASYTPRMIEFLKLCAAGYRQSEIAKILGVSERTVEWNIDELKQRLYAFSSAHLVAIAISIGVLDPNEFVPSLEKECPLD